MDSPSGYNGWFSEKGLLDRAPITKSEQFELIKLLLFFVNCIVS
jgi:hypothetical protein